MHSRLRIIALAALGVLMTLAFVSSVCVLFPLRFMFPFLNETRLLPWATMMVFSIAITSFLAWLGVHRSLVQGSAKTTSLMAMLVVTLLLGITVFKLSSAARRDCLARVANLGLSSLEAPIPTYYSGGGKARAERIQADLRAMNDFFHDRLGVRAEVTLAVLDSEHWSRAYPFPYGLPGVLGEPTVLFMPAQTGGFAFRMLTACKEEIPPDLLAEYLKAKQTTFETAVDDFVDFIALHELGHRLTIAYGIDPGCLWLGEFVANYFAYTFLAERQPERKSTLALLGRPYNSRPRNTTLDEFERLYFLVDDLNWYQNMFHLRIQELYPRMGIELLRELKRDSPPNGDGVQSYTDSKPFMVNLIGPEIGLQDWIGPERALTKVEAIAPGFRSWAQEFNRRP